jgi:hypothetical protein
VKTRLIRQIRVPKNKITMEKLLHSEITDAIIKVYYDVYNELGYGFI